MTFTPLPPREREGLISSVPTSPDTTGPPNLEEPVASVSTSEAAEVMRRELQECFGNGPTITTVCIRCRKMGQTIQKMEKLRQSLVVDVQRFHKRAMNDIQQCNAISKDAAALSQQRKRTLVQALEMSKALDALDVLVCLGRLPSDVPTGRVEPMMNGHTVVTL